MKSYLVTMFNSKKNRQERYCTSAENEEDAVLALSLFLENVRKGSKKYD